MEVVQDPLASRIALPTQNHRKAKLAQCQKKHLDVGLFDIWQSTGNAMSGMKAIAFVLLVAALAATRLRQGHEQNAVKQSSSIRRQRA